MQIAKVSAALFRMPTTPVRWSGQRAVAPLKHTLLKPVAMLRKHGVGMKMTILSAFPRGWPTRESVIATAAIPTRTPQRYFMRPPGPFCHRRFGADE